MADEEEKEEGQEQGEQSGNKKKLIILAVVCSVLIVVSVVGTMFALDMFSGAEEEMVNADLAPAKPQAETLKPAIYYPLKPAIIVNFQARGRQRFLQAELTLLVRDEMVIQAVETHMPMIRNSLVMLFGGQTYEELQTAEGKELLQEQAVQQLQALLEQETGKPGVEKVLFTNFVMQ
jgi:flagellar FliL protein